MKALQTGIDARAAIRQAPILEALQKQKLASMKADAERSRLGLTKDKFIGTPSRTTHEGRDFLTGLVQGADGLSLKSIPIDGEFVSQLGETAEEQTNRAIRQSGGQRGAVLEKDLEVQPQITAAVDSAKLPGEARSQQQSSNIERINVLSSDAKARSANISKARSFLRPLKLGKAKTGAGRSAASFVPGVYTSQGEFDEKFNAFAEVAARQKLKASGETRPTDSDVEGMKRAMFGVGRDEEVNIQLLEEFIEELEMQDDELNELQSARRSGTLADFVVGAEPQAAQPVEQPVQSFNFDAQGNLIP
jgi:hypothetical protein